MIYVLGLGLPIFLLVLALKGGGNHREVSRLLRGRSITLSIGGKTLFLHSTAMISGLLLIGLGVLLATGQMTMLSQELAGSRLAQLGVEIEGWIPGS
jgi:cytochrome c-type biogenesis protein